MEQLGRTAADLVQSPQQLTGSWNVSRDRMAAAATHARILLGCYRSGEANDPDVYVAAVASVLAHYPADLMAQVSDPHAGISAKIKWLPSISEVRDECERLAAAERAERKRAEDSAEQWRLREEWEGRHTAEPLTTVDPCNLFVRRGHPGFQEMQNAYEAKAISHLKWDSERDGINISLHDYQRLVGPGTGGR